MVIIESVVKSRAEEIEHLIASNDLDTATFRLMDFARDLGNSSNKNEAIVIRSTLTELGERERLYGPDQNSDAAKTRLRLQILKLLSSIIPEPDLEPKPGLQNDVVRVNTKIDDRGPVEPKDSTELEYEKRRFFARLSDQKRAEDHAVKTLPDNVFLGQGITKTYKRGSKKFTLHPFDLELKSGEITGVVGENGNGKTTLLKLVAGVLRSDDGLLSYPQLTGTGKLDWYEVKQQIAYVPQELPQWYSLLTENLHFVASMHGLRGTRNIEEVEWIIYRLGLEEYRNAHWNELPGGFKTRASLAKALIVRPKLLILDEPLASLDISAQKLFLRDLRDLAGGIQDPIAVLFSSQHLYEVESIADNIIFLKGGEATYNGSVEEFGSDRKENTFEIACQLTRKELEDLLAGWDYVRLEVTGNSYIISTPVEVIGNSLLAVFLEAGIQLTYFRDISKSTRKLFGDHQ